MGPGVYRHGHAHDTGRRPVLRRPGEKQNRSLDDRPVIPGLRHSQHSVGALWLQPVLRA